MLVCFRESICVKSGGGDVGIYRLLMEHARIIFLYLKKLDFSKIIYLL